MKLDLTEKYLLYKRRAWQIDKSICFHADMYKLKNKKFPIPKAYEAMDLGEISIGEVAFILRWRSTLTTRGLGEVIGVSHQTITNWEYDRKGGVIRQLRYLENFLTPLEKAILKNTYGIKL